MKIFFVGNLNSPFVHQDLEILREYHKVVPFDISEFLLSPSHMIRFIIETIKSFSEVNSSDLIWIWFADIHAVPFILISKLRGTPVIICQGDYEVTNDPENNYGNQRSFIRGALTRWIMRNATKCVMPSPIYEIIAREVEPRASICTIPCGIEIPEKSYPKEENLVITATISEESRIRKGIPMFEEISRVVPRYNMRILVGVSRSEYIDALKRAKVYCQLSFFESFGVSLVEAMSYGCIPVVTDRGALPWVVGDCGLVVPYGDILKTKEAIDLALKSGPADVLSVRNQAKKFGVYMRKINIRKLIFEGKDDC